jgi:hypothetical protein
MVELLVPMNVFLSIQNGFVSRVFFDPKKFEKREAECIRIFYGEKWREDEKTSVTSNRTALPIPTFVVCAH